MPWRYAEVEPDFVVGSEAAAIYISIRYHLLHPVRPSFPAPAAHRQEGAGTALQKELRQSAGAAAREDFGIHSGKLAWAGGGPRSADTQGLQAYLRGRLLELAGKYRVRVLLCHVDVESTNSVAALEALALLAFRESWTMLVCWTTVEVRRLACPAVAALALRASAVGGDGSADAVLALAEQVARYIESLKCYEKKSADVIQGRVETDFSARLTASLTAVRLGTPWPCLCCTCSHPSPPAPRGRQPITMRSWPQSTRRTWPRSQTRSAHLLASSMPLLTSCCFARSARQA